MLNKRSPLFILVIFGIFFYSCSTLKVTEAYFQKVKPGRQGANTKTEFVILFKNLAKKDISIKEMTIFGYEGSDYYFSDLVLNNILLNKTLTGTDKLKSFALYVNTNKAKKKTASKAPSLLAMVTFSNGIEDKILEVKTFKNKGIKQLRN